MKPKERARCASCSTIDDRGLRVDSATSKWSTSHSQPALEGTPRSIYRQSPSTATQIRSMGFCSASRGSVDGRPRPGDDAGLGLVDLGPSERLLRAAQFSEANDRSGSTAGSPALRLTRPKVAVRTGPAASGTVMCARTRPDLGRKRSPRLSFKRSTDSISL